MKTSILYRTGDFYDHFSCDKFAKLYAVTVENWKVMGSKLTLRQSGCARDRVGTVKLRDPFSNTTQVRCI
jgi:hypothetical protein